MNGETPDRKFPVGAGIMLGVGLGGLFDGIVLHQLLQWHHMVTDAGYPADSLSNLEFNTLWDGIFHAVAYVLVVVGLALLWLKACRSHIRWSRKLLPGSVLIGFGAFNLVEGAINHHLLGIHHVNETVAPEEWIGWDLGFLACSAMMLLVGWLLLYAGHRKTTRGMAR